MKPFRGAAVLVLLALLVGPAAASAASRLVVNQVRRDRGGVVSKQLTSALCRSLECAPRTSAYRGNKPDFARARRNGVAGIVLGAVTGAPPNRLLWLGLYTGPGDPERTWSLPVGRNGLVSRRSLDAVVREIERRIGPRAPPPAPLAAPPPPRAAPPATPLAPPPPEPPPARPALRAAEPPPRAAPAAPPLPPPERTAARVVPAARPRWAALELGAAVAERDLSYDGATPVGTSPLMTMSATILCPSAYVEIFPAALFTRGLISGLGAFADYRRSIGFEIRDGSVTHSAKLSRIGAGVTWRLPPLSSLGLGLSPAVSYERRDLTVTDTAIPGLPDAHLRGVRIGAGLSVPIAGRLALLVSGGYVSWTAAGDLADEGGGFFPSGSASAVEVEAGLSIPLPGRFSARILGEYSSTEYDLDEDPSGTYRASGATDRYWGGRATLRAEL